MGLDVYLTERGEEVTFGDDRVKSTKHPEHLFTPTYLRSSYNGGGFNSLVGNVLDGRDLYWIFEPIGTGEYEIHPTKEQLTACRERAVTLLADLDKAKPLGAEGYSAIPLRPDLRQVNSEEEAISAYREEQERYEASVKAAEEEGRKSFGGSYSNALGYFYLDAPLLVRGVFAGKGFRGPSVYLVYDLGEGFAWYLAAAEIVIEFIDNALSMTDPEIHWSA